MSITSMAVAHRFRLDTTFSALYTINRIFSRRKMKTGHGIKGSAGRLSMRAGDCSIGKGWLRWNPASPAKSSRSSQHKRGGALASRPGWTSASSAGVSYFRSRAPRV